MRIVSLLLVVLVLASCSQNKIGYVDNLGLLEDYQEKLEAENKFNAQVEKLTKKRDSLNQSFQLELQELQTKAKRLSQKDAQDQYNLLQQRGQFAAQQLQQEEQQIQQSSQAVIDSIVSKIKTEVEAYGKANGYTYILTAGDGGGVLYGNESQDLTKELLTILNDKYKQ